MTAQPDGPPRRPIRPLAWPFIAAIRLYQWTLAPHMAGHCRFSPTCSAYALEAFRTHRPLRATMLTLSRLGRCHPLCRGGFDPVPLPPEEADQPLATDSRISTQIPFK